MTVQIAGVLAQHADEYVIEECLHAVPPHEVWKVTVDGRPAVCKVATHRDGDPATEGAVIDHVHEETSVPVPAIRAVGRHHFVAEWRDDAPTEDGAVVDEGTVRALGRTMASLHEETSFRGYGFPASEGGTLTAVARDSWSEVVYEYVRDCQAALEPVDYDDEAALVAELVADAPHLLDGTDAPVLCHGNLLPAHVAVDAGRPTCVIDFEHALIAPAEYDVWRTVMPVFHGDRDHGVDERIFRDGYESVRPLSDGLGRRRRIYTLVNFVSYLRSLDLQNRGIGADERARADGMAETIRDGVRSIRSTQDV